ncbi:MAG: fibronectin type III domain-containing protein [Lentimicrobium sp.]|uniref:fibronectin type III domain-containing protein n=1 Tax=Lentimicrobium sp. TaxID=2034841 RepID=UPI0025D07F58|nr:fibronectin type III domain-containing protein [Lentimicrobium sp.]MCO5256200.1 fibronectin type III domain-containing protein [Lentimicrobium sp.]
MTGADPWTNLGTSPTQTTSQTVATYYRCQVTCSGNTGTSNPVLVGDPAPPTTQASAIVVSNLSLAGGVTIGWTSGNGGRRYVVVNNVNSFTDPVGTGDIVVAGTVYSGSGEQIVYDGTGNSVAITGLASNTTYYARVYEYQRCVGTPNTNYYNTGTATNNPNSFTTLINNDLCADAITLPCGGSIAGTTLGSTNEGQAVCGITGVTVQNTNGVWYKINPGAEAQDITVTTCVPSGGTDTRMAVFSGSCGDLTCIGGNDDNPGCTTATLTSEVLFAAAANTDYYILVYMYSSNGAPFTISASCVASCSPATLNDVCADAQDIDVVEYGGTATSTNNTCSTAEGTVTYPSCGSSFGSYYDVWYKFNTGVNTTGTIKITLGTATGLGFAIYSGECATLTQVSSTCNITSETEYPFTLTASTDYYLRVFTTSAATRGTFDLAIQEPIPTPILLITPSTKDYGTVAVGGSSTQVFTIKNDGGGTLIIDPQVSVTGTDADQFILTDANEYPLNLTAGQTATVSVAFTPTSGGAKSASLVIVDNLGSKATNTVPLTGTGFVPPPGSTCDNPYPITLPLVDFSGNTSTMGDDYSSTWITPNSLYMNGDDMVFEFTLTEAGYLGGSMTTTDSYLGLFILEDCPDPVSPAAVLRSATSSGTSVTLTEILLQPGTYFAIVSSWPSPQSIEFILNLSFEPLPDCPTPTALTATPASFSAELGWTENGTATLWDIEWGEAGFTPGEGTVITGVSNPYTLTGLEFSTPYDFYVRADCGEGSVSDWSVVKNFSTLAACPAPSVLTATSVTATSAVLGWTENGSATSWDIEYGQTPFTPTGTPSISGVTNPYTLTGLSSGIPYAYYVRAYCDETYQSTWSGPLTFTTQTVVPAPYTEGFITTSTPTGWTTTGWLIGSVRGATGNPGNNIYRNLWSSATTGTFTTVNVGPVVSGMSLTFDYQLTNYDSPYDPPAEGSGNFIVSVSTDFGLNYTELETTDNDGEAGWRSKSYDLSAYAGSNIKVRIVGNRTSGDYDLAFDNFYIGLPITCPAPTDVIATAVTQTSATISWTAPDPAPANGYEYEVRNDGDPGSGATGLAASGTTAAGVTSADITGLEDGTDYMIYVRSVCGTENYSNWAEGSFFTPCDVIIAPFIETVEEGELSPCWTIGTSGDGSWFLSSAASGYGIGLRSFIAPFYAISDPSPFDLYTPEFDASALVNPQLEFDFAYATFIDEVDQLDVLYSTDGGINYSLLLAMPGGTDGILNTGGASTSSFAPTASQWETQVLALPANTNRIAFRATSAYGNNLYIDNIKIVSAPVTSKTLNLKAYIQGFWNGSAMNQAQDVDQDENIFNKFSGTTVDTLSVYLAEADAPWAYLFAAHEVNINTDGSMVISVPAAFSGSYYIVIDHHSSVETWSAVPVDFSGTTIDYDFTTAAEQAYGSNQKSMGTVWALYSGDVNDDEYIEFLDVVPIYNLSTTGFFGYSLFDIDGSGYIEFFDYIMANNNSIIGAGMNTPPNPAKRPGFSNTKPTN